MNNNNDKEIVFDTHWFKKHQSKILWLANSWVGKYIFRFKKMGHYLDPKKKIAKLTPYSVAQLNKVDKKGAEYTEHFFSRNEYARKLYFVLLPMWYALHVWDWFVADHFHLAPQLSFGFSTLTQYPQSIGTNNPKDGYVKRGGVNESFATIIAGAGNDYSMYTASDNFIKILSTATTNQYSELVRSIFCFDTSSLTAGATISAVIMSLYGTLKADAGTAITPDIDIYTATPASTSGDFDISDYGQVGSTSQTGSPISYAGYNDAGYNDFTFNATGRGNISKTGISKFGARNANYDVAASAPTWTASKWHQLNGYFTYNGSNKPKLVVTYTAPPQTNIQINIGDTWKTVTDVKINIGDTWKTVTKAQINIGDVWKTIF